MGNAAVLVPAGSLVDRIGPRRPLIVGGLVSGGVLVAGAFAPNAWLLGLSLLAFGIAGAFVAIAGTVSIFHQFDADKRGFALGIRQMSVSGGGLVAAVLLPGLAALGGVRAALIASGLLAAAFATRFGLASPRGAFHDGPPHGRGGFRELLGVPGIGRVLAIALVHVCALAAVLNFAVPQIRDNGATAVVGAALFAVISIAAMLARLTWGALADCNGGRRRWTTLRDVGLVTVVGALGYWLLAPAGPALALPVMFVLAFGAMGANGVLHVLGGELAGPARAGQAVGLVSMVLFGGGALASIPLGALADHAGFQALWPMCAILASATVLLSATAPRHLQTRGGDDDLDVPAISSGS